MLYPIYCFKKESTGLFPKNLWQVPESPAEIYIQGSKTALHLLDSLPERGLAIVGTRHPQLRSLCLLRESVRQLKGSSLIIVSGLALGIDACAHLAALQAGLPTLAILACGLNLNYPKENDSLRQTILEADGLIASEFPLGTQAQKHHFLMRNRLIAGWSKASWIVEAGQRSGSLNTARWAREQDRTCLTVPCYPREGHFEGNQLLLDRDHALAFWGVHSLGAVWLDLATYPQKSLSNPTAQTDR